MKGNIRIGGAIILGIAIVIGAYFLRPELAANGTEEIAVITTPQREYVAAKETDGNGIKDWEEALQKKIFAEVPKIEISTSTEGGEPKTYTDQFARSFFEDFINSRTGNAPPTTQEDFLSNAVQSIERSTGQNLYSEKDIIFGEDGETAIRAYGNSAGEIFIRNQKDNENEMTILQRALETDNKDILADLDPIAETYNTTIEELLVVPVPPSLTKAHLDLLNALNAILLDIKAMRAVYDDPLLALARIKRYQDDATGFYYALVQLLSFFEENGVRYANDEPGSFFYIVEP